jgi:DNA-binding NarL/FixJ family response regulator
MIRIGIVDDHHIVRRGLRDFLSEEVDLRVTGEAANGHEALELARQGEVDVLLMDLSMPGQGGVDALQAIKARFPQLPVVILSGLPEQQYAVALIRQGASGYLGKDCDPSEIAAAVRTVARGRRYVTPAVAELLADTVGRGEVAPALPHQGLSERELQVFLRLAGGETVGHIAETLHLSVKTVSTYRSRVLEKLALQTNSDLTYYALKNGLMQ